MNPGTGHDEPGARPTKTSAKSHAAGWLEATGGRARSLVRLAVAEAQLAALSVTSMVMLAVLAAVGCLGAWGLAIAGCTVALLNAGVPLAVVLLGFAVLHVLAAFWAWHTACGLAENLEFPVTRAEIRNGGRRS